MSEKKANDMNEEKEDFGTDIMTLVDEDGTEREFEVIDNLVTDDNEYFALVPTETADNLDTDDGELVILKVVEDNGEEFLEPMVQGLLAINGFVGRFGGKKVHWTFFYFHLTPSSANIILKT